MNYVRILEYAVLPDRPQGEWYAHEGSSAVVRLVRSNDLLDDAGEDDSRATTSWTGVRTYRCGSERQGSLVFMLKYPVPLDYQDEFDAWFRDEHMPMLLEEPTWYGCSFYRTLRGSRYPFAALHNLEPQALTSDARNRSVDTPWWHRLKKHAWFDKDFIRARLRRIEAPSALEHEVGPTPDHEIESVTTGMKQP